MEAERGLIDKIKELKRKKEAIILAHNYQRPEVQEIADFLGDSFGLSQEAARSPHKLIVFCGVKFMAESAKILSPEKTVLLPRMDVGCPMADMVTVEGLRELRSKHPEAKVVCYVNTNADVKAECDVCCTSTNARQVIENMEAEKVIFVPDRNLADFVARFNEKEIIPWDGYCYVHQKMGEEEVTKAKAIRTDAKLLVHPECKPEVVDLADEVLSTGGMVRYARSSEARRFLIATEEGLIHRLQRENPDKEFYTAGMAHVCVNMKKIRLEDVYRSLLEEEFEVKIPEEVQKKARQALDEMLKYT